MAHKFKASYDENGDVLTIYAEGSKVKESIEVAEELVVDIDKNDKLVSLELMDAYKFLHTLNKEITKDMLLDVQEVELDAKNFRNYWVITLMFKYEDKIISEKLPAFVSSDFKSPLIASVTA